MPVNALRRVELSTGDRGRFGGRRPIRVRAGRTFCYGVALAAGLVCAAPASAAVPDSAAQLKRLGQARALWNAQHLRSYSFRLRRSCFCPNSGMPVTIRVRNGHPSGGAGFDPQLATVPRLFHQIEHVLKDPMAGSVTVHYDKRRGFAASAALDPIKNAIDDEFGWTISAFHKI